VNFPLSSIGLIICFIIWQAQINSAFALEGFANNPGTRAMGMAGAFTAQGDDSSAIWYNPSAPIHYNYIQQDFSFALTNRISSQDQRATDNLPSTEFFPNFLAYYTRTSFSLINQMPIGLGVSYFSPYKVNVYIDAPQSLVNDQEFGGVNARYHQFSSMINLAPSPALSIGGTIDFLWLNINCKNYKPCVDFGPTAFGASLGGLYELVNNQHYVLNVGATWRSRAKLVYRSTPSSGIGGVLTDYVPDRPDTKNIGLSLQIPTSLMLVNSNIVIERVAWSSTVEQGKLLSNYHNIGSSIELMSLTKSGKSFAARIGGKLLNNRSTGNFDVAIASLGFGYEVIKSHMIDFAFEHRKFRTTDSTTNAWSVSYSWQSQQSLL